MDASIPEKQVPFSLRLASVSETLAQLEVFTTDHSVGRRGRLNGPSNAYARTLTVDTPLIPSGPRVAGQPLKLVADVHEACLWEPGYPFLYTLTLPGDPPTTRKIGFRSLVPTKAGLRLNGQPFRVQGLALSSPTITEEQLRTCRNWGVNWLEGVSPEYVELTDRFGPFVSLAYQPGDADRDIGPVNPSVGTWVVPIGDAPPHSTDHTTPLARSLDLQNSPVSDFTSLPVDSRDLLIVRGTRPMIEDALTRLDPSIVVLARVTDLRSGGSHREAWEAARERLEDMGKNDSRLVGWIMETDSDLTAAPGRERTA